VVAALLASLFGYLGLSSKASRDADDALTMVMNRIMGAPNWERGRVDYDLLKGTLTVEKLVLRLPENPAAVRIDIERATVKGAPSKSEIERIVALKAWVDQPATNLFEEVVLEGITVLGGPDQMLTQASVARVSSSGAALAATGPVKGSTGPFWGLSFKTLAFGDLRGVVEDEVYSLTFRLGEMSFGDWAVAADDLKTGDPRALLEALMLGAMSPGDWADATNDAVALLKALRLGEYAVRDVEIDLKLPEERFNLTLAEESFKGMAGLAYESASLKDLRIRLQTPEAPLGVTARLGRVEVKGVDYSPALVWLSRIPYADNWPALQRLLTVGDLVTGTVACDSVEAADLEISIVGEVSVTLGSLLISGPFRPGTVPAKSVWSVAQFIVAVDPGGFSPYLDELRQLASFTGLYRVNLSSSITCDYLAASGDLDCRGAPTLAAEDLFEQTLSLSLSGLTPDFLKKLQTLSLENLADLGHLSTWAAGLRLKSLRLEAIDHGLEDKLYALAGNYGLTRDKVRRELKREFSRALEELVSLDQWGRLQAALSDYIDQPRRFALEMAPAITLAELINMDLEDPKAINALCLGVSVNGGPAIALTYGLGDRAPSLAATRPPAAPGAPAKTPPSGIPKTPPAEPAPGDDLPDPGAREMASALADRELASALAEGKATLTMALDRLFQPGRWSVGSMAIDPETSALVAESLLAELPGEGLGPLAAKRIILRGAAAPNEIRRVLYAVDWVDQPATPLVGELSIEEIIIPINAGDATGEIRAGSARVRNAVMNPGGPDTIVTAMGFWSNLALGRMVLGDIEATMSGEGGESATLALSSVELVAPAMGRGRIDPPGPLEDPLAFLRGLSADEVRLGGLALSAASRYGTLTLDVGALTVSEAANLKAIHKSLDNLRYEVKRKASGRSSVALSIKTLDLAGLDPSSLLARLEPDYRALIAAGQSPMAALFDRLADAGSYLRSLDALSPPVALDSLEREGARLANDELAVTIDRLEATGPWRPGAVAPTQRVEFQGRLEFPESNAQAPPDSLEGLLGVSSAPFSGSWRVVHDPKAATLTWTLSPLLALEGQGTLEGGLALQGVTGELVGFLSLSPAKSPSGPFSSRASTPWP
jgi:hypothetical protein